MNIGRHVWVIADGHIPPYSSGADPAMTSHESACILNASDEAASVRLFMYFTSREPAGPYLINIPARRAHHQRLNDLDNPEPMPIGVDYCCVIRSDKPIVVQHTRLDSRQAANALMSTIAYPVA
jgi:hypothetical protein